MQCPGSAALLTHIAPIAAAEHEEPEYRSRGTTAHAVAHHCLVNGIDTWEVVGTKFEKHEVDAPIANAVQVYLNECRSIQTPDAEVFYEYKMDHPEFHPDFFGTLDFAVIRNTTLYLRDYKHGEGIAVEARDNPQLMYYAWGLMLDHPAISVIDMAIVQPRAYHEQGTIRRWIATANHIETWARDDLQPAMARAQTEREFVTGEHCRFCPAKLACPALRGLWKAAVVADKTEIKSFSNDTLGYSYTQIAGVKKYIAALEAEAYNRLMAGQKVPNIKLVNKKAYRVWKPGAEAQLKEKLGVEAVMETTMRSPAQLEDASALAKQLVREWAYVPNTGQTVALESDKRPAQTPDRGSEVFEAPVLTAAE
jgi:hypothetical protein